MLHRLGFDYRKPEAMPRGLDDAKQQAFIHDAGGTRYQAPLAGQIKKTSSCQKQLLLVVVLIVLLESPKFAAIPLVVIVSAVSCGAPDRHDLYEAAAYTHVTMGFWDKLGSDRFGPLPRKVSAE